MTGREKEGRDHTMRMAAMLNEILIARKRGEPEPYAGKCISCLAGCPKNECIFCRERQALYFPEVLDPLDAEEVSFE